MKMHILQEIRRTAALNGGVPLGSRGFANETGIREPDWKGKIWARWSDALQEAGFAPNKLTTPYTELDLLEKYAKLTIELGRLPTAHDIRLAAHNGLPFPEWGTLKRRFGGKPQLVEKLAKYCEGHAKYGSVVPLCNAYEPRLLRDADQDSGCIGQIGYVYLLKHGARREYKIGRTSNPLRREDEIAIELPEKVQPVHVIATDDPTGIEAYWHRRFESKRKNGEWFELNATDLAAFKRRKFM